MEQVFAERPGADAGREIGVGGGNETKVRADHPPSSETTEFPFLKEAQEPRLRFEREIGDLVEEERRAVGELEDADPGTIGPRERAALVAEELALEERRRHRVAVLGDELPGGSRA